MIYFWKEYLLVSWLSVMANSNEDRIDRLKRKVDFVQCPLCRSRESLSFNERDANSGSVTCKSCGAVWNIEKGNPSGPAFWVTLQKPANDGVGKRLVGRRVPLAFWRRIASRGQALAVGEQRGTTVIKEVVKIRCKYCDTIYDISSGKCPNCGAPP